MIQSYHFPVHSRHSKRARRISAHVKPEGIEVVLPLTAKLEQAVPLLDQHAAWFLRKWQELKEQHEANQAQHRQWPLQLELKAIQTSLTLHLAKKNNFHYLQLNFSEQQWQVYNSEILLGSTLPSKHEIIELIQSWLKDFAYKIFQPKLIEISRHMQLPFKKLAINLAKTCWGSCTSQKHIALNASLLFFEPICLDYVIIHECAHLQHMNHSRTFWKLVAQYCPNYAMIKTQLKHKSKILPLWLYDAAYLELPQLETSMEETR